MMKVTISSDGEKTKVEASVCGSFNDIINESLAFVRAVYSGVNETNPDGGMKYKAELSKAVLNGSLFEEIEETEKQGNEFSDALKAIRSFLEKKG